MTIEKGASWGEIVERPSELHIVADDAALAAALSGDAAPLAVRSGDLFATVGGRPVEGRDQLLRVPIDAVRVRLDGGEGLLAVAHVVLRAPWWAGGPLRGGICVVMNAEFLGRLELAPRGHPNDGRVEVLEFSADVPLRQRLAMRRRARSAAHLPHPGISTRSVRSVTWSFERPRVAVVDGVRRGRVRDVAIEVVPDRGVLHV